MDYTIKDSGARTEYNTGAVRDIKSVANGRFDLLPWRALMQVAVHCAAGAEKYGDHNVDKGIPWHSLYDSGARHMCKFKLGWVDEDHLTAACWNMLWLLEERFTHPELDDMPREMPDAESK